MYKLTTSGWLKREDGAFINPENNVEYLEWLKAGNTPEPADPIIVAEEVTDPVEKLKNFLQKNSDVAAILNS